MEMMMTALLKVLCILSLLVLVAVHTALRGKEGKMFISNNITYDVPVSVVE